MCPACVAGAAWIIGSVMTTGGAGALGLKGLRRKKALKTPGANYRTEERRQDNGKCNEQAGCAQGGHAG